MSGALFGALDRLSTDTERRLVSLYATYQAGDIEAEAFLRYAVALVGRARARAFALADVSLAAWMSANTGRATPALGLTLPVGDLERLSAGVGTLLGADPTDGDLVKRVARFGRSEPAKALQVGYVDAMRQRGIAGYTRVLSPGACELCRWLGKDGAMFSVDVDFHQHTGCLCYPAPVLEGEVTA